MQAEKIHSKKTTKLFNDRVKAILLDMYKKTDNEEKRKLIIKKLAARQ